MSGVLGAVPQFLPGGGAYYTAQTPKTVASTDLHFTRICFRITLCLFVLSSRQSDVLHSKLTLYE